jgi:hypothetical protein
VTALNVVAAGLILFLGGWGLARLMKNQLAVRSVLFLPKFDCKFTGGPEELAKLSEQWGTRQQAHQLAELGFVPLGTRLEMLWGQGREEALCWGHPTAKCFSSIWRFGETPKLFFVSVQGTKLAVLTANYPRTAEPRLSGAIRTSAPGTIRETFEAHQKTLRELEGGGAVFDGGSDQAASCKSSIDYFRNPDVLGQYRENLRWRLREAGIGVLALLGAAVVATVVLLKH